MIDEVRGHMVPLLLSRGHDRLLAQEAFRVLRPGGRIRLSPTLPAQTVLRALAAAGFVAVKLEGGSATGVKAVTATAPVPEQSAYVRVVAWLGEHPVPPSGCPEMDEWRAGAQALGPEAVDVLIDLLREAEPNMQYGALLALRQLGVEAWAYDYEPNLYYEVTLPGRAPQRIVPRLQQTH